MPWAPQVQFREAPNSMKKNTDAIEIRREGFQEGSLKRFGIQEGWIFETGARAVSGLFGESFCRRILRGP